MIWKFENLYLNGQWEHDIFVTIDSKGSIHSISHANAVNADETVSGYAMPGFKNAHSHAFQYAMVGMTENINIQHPNDDFWSWRKSMYKLANSLTPDQIKIIARELYRQMIQAGYTWVAEFHYLHHDTDGTFYSYRAETANALLEAAKETGIGITLVPVFYQRGGFNSVANDQQKRFISKSVDDYFELVESTRSICKNERQSWAYGLHSLRAVDAHSILKFDRERTKNIPVHIHISEQIKEVEECVSATGLRPIEWLIKNCEVNEHWHLVHATHANTSELKEIVTRNSHVVLCPSTEANLGDGIFPLSEYIKLNGNWSIGSDSHILLNPIEELRWLEYSQRLVAQKRNVLCTNNRYESGSILFDDSISSGQSAMGLSPQILDVGQQLDLVVFEPNGLLDGTAASQLMSTIIFSQNTNRIKGTITGGKWRYQRITNDSQLLQPELAQWSELSKKIRNV